MLVACVLSALTNLWLHPSQPSAEVTLGARAACVVVALGGYLAVLGRARKRPAAWQADPEHRRFTATPGPLPAGTTAVVGGWAAGTAATATGRLDTLGGILIGLGAVLMAALTVRLLLGHPILILTPDGLTVVRSRDAFSVRWDDLADDTLHPSGRHNLRAPILIERTEAGGTRKRVLPVDRLHIDPEFAAATVRRYVEHPARRAEIGTAAEVEALQPA